MSTQRFDMTTIPNIFYSFTKTSFTIETDKQERLPKEMNELFYKL